MLCLAFSISSFAEPQVVEKIVAIVNSEIISETDLKAFTKKLDKAGLIDDLLLFGKTAQEVKKDRAAELNYIIYEKILESEIKRMNLSVTSERVEQEIKDIAKRNGVPKNELLSAIKSQGLTVSEYQDFIKTRVERQSLIEAEITSKIRVSDEDVMAFYTRKNPTSNTASYEYQLAHILFNPKKGGIESAKKRADAVLAKIRRGAAFEEMAQQNSEDPNFTNDGVLGSFKAGDFSKEFDEALKGLGPGEVSPVTVSKAGFHILKILQKKIVADPKFEAQKEKLRNELFEKSFQGHFKNWIEQKKEDSFVRINL